MVVLAVAVMTKAGKMLVSRHFVEMTRIRIEGLLAAFPKLVSTVQKTHNYVETENVRYVYHPVENLYIVMVTNKASNILEDLETLKLLARVVPEYCDYVDEEGVGEHSFEIIFAFDEVVSMMGFKENITLTQVRACTEMASHEEKLANMIKANKIEDANKRARDKAKEIARDKDEQRRLNNGRGGMGGMGGGMGGIGGGMGSSMGGSMGHSNVSSSVRDNVVSQEPERADTSAKGGPSKGMKLGGTKKNTVLLKNLKAEGVEITDAPSAAAVLSTNISTPTGPVVSMEPFHLATTETISASLDTEGNLNSMELKGDLSVTVRDGENAVVRVYLDCETKQFQFKTHPNIDKDLFFATEPCLGLKDASRPFPTGNPLPLLRWRLQTKDESFLPISISCWVSAHKGRTHLNLEYELKRSNMDISDLKIVIPLPEAPEIVQCDGDCSYDSRNHCARWITELVDSKHDSGSLELALGESDASNFYPISISFVSSTSICSLRVLDVRKLDGSEASLRYSNVCSLTTEEFTVTQ